MRKAPPSSDWLGLDCSPLVPDEFAEFRPLVSEAVLFFLERLSMPRIEELAACQCALPADATDEERLATLITRCPTLHKLGQVVARDRRLAPGLRRHLQGLESMEPVTPFAQVAETIRREISADCAQAMAVDSRPLAEASVAVVIPFTTGGPSDEGRRHGVMKVLKPDITERLGEELEIWSILAPFIDERCRQQDLPALRCSEIFEAVRDLLSKEVRLDLEQAHLTEAARFYADSDKVQIPQVMPCSTPGITIMERVFGTKVTDAGHLSEAERKELAGLVLRELVAKPIWSKKSWAMFHADPHAGNLFYTYDHRLAILDWSLVGHLDKTEREQTAQIVLGAFNLDPYRVRWAIAAMAISVPDETALCEVVDRAVGALYRTEPPSLHWLLNLLGDAMFKAGVGFGEDLVLFRKSVLTLEGVAADVSTGTSLSKVLPLSGGLELLREWARRCIASPISRDFGTHVSNLDLLSLYFAAPSAAGRFISDLLFRPSFKK
jgi:ubiquinone biosynthesis protein